MDTDKLKWTRLQSEIFRFLSINAGKLVNKRNIAKNLGVSPTAVAKSLIGMKKQEIVKIERQGGMNLDFIELNRDNLLVIGLKRADNLKMIYESRILEFLEEKLPGTTIVLFGSYSKGYDMFNSDVDIAVIGSNKKNIDLSKYEKIFGKEFRLNFYTGWNEINKNLKNNLLNGVVLVGGVEL